MPIFDLLRVAMSLVTTNASDHCLNLHKARHHLAVTFASSSQLGLNLLQMFKNEVLNVFGHAFILSNGD